MFEDDVLQTVALRSTYRAGIEHAYRRVVHADDTEAHAAARWARTVVPIIESPKDPRTIAGWSRYIGASPGALRNWCRTGRIAPRKALVFGRLLRAVVLGEAGRHRPENLLDVADRRTLIGLLRFAGFQGEHDLPADVGQFLERQTLVRDPDAIKEVRRALDEHRWTRAHVGEAVRVG